jgi:uncharacterized protein (TIGR02453 family)
MTAGDDARFRPEFFQFFRELTRNNNRPWFQRNKRRYEEDVLAPSLAFAEAMGPAVGKISSSLVVDPRPVGGSLMRIYRDVRFSKDKTPYRTAMGIHFFHRANDRHDGGLPGFFLRLAPDDSIVAAGTWMPAPADLTAIRATIVRNPEGWKKARAVALDAYDDDLKRVPRGFDPDGPYADDLRRKSFTASTPLRERDITAAGFPDRFLGECRRLDPLNSYLAKAIGVPY